MKEDKNTVKLSEIADAKIQSDFFEIWHPRVPNRRITYLC